MSAQWFLQLTIQIGGVVSRPGIFFTSAFLSMFVSIFNSGALPTELLSSQSPGILPTETSVY